MSTGHRNSHPGFDSLDGTYPTVLRPTILLSMPGLRRCALILVALALASPVDAQRRSQFTLEGSVGRGTGGGGGERVDRGGFAIDGVISWRGRTHLGSGPIIGADLGWQGKRGSTDICKVQMDGRCVPTYPSFTMMSVLGGWELARGLGPSLRLLAGAGLFVRELGPGSPGFTGRIDLGTPIRGGIALIGSGRVGITSPRGDRHTLSAITIGVRLH